MRPSDVYICICIFRGVGCIFYEMACGRPLFPGSTVDDELELIFKVCLYGFNLLKI